MRRAGAGALAAAFLATATGCGDDAPPPERVAEEEVRAVTGRYVDALARGDGEAACRLVTPEGRARVERDAGTACASAVTGGALPAESLAVARRQLPGARVKLDGLRATIGPLADSPAPLALERVGGRWLVSG